MSSEEINEMIKAFSFGFTVSQVATECDISETEAAELKKKYSAEIDKRKAVKYE